MDWGLAEKAMMREPLSNLIIPTLTLSVKEEGLPRSSRRFTSMSVMSWKVMNLVRLKISANL